VSRYLQLAEALRAEVGSLRSNDRIPSERELAERFGVSRMTMRHAIERLVNLGLLYRVQGSGTYVRDRTVAKGVDLLGFSEEMIARGMAPSSRVIAVAVEPAGSSIGPDLKISPTDLVYHLERLRSADGEPMVHEQMWLVADADRQLLTCDLSGSMYRLLRERFGLQPTSAQQTVRPVMLDDRTSSLLSVPPMSVALEIKRTSYSQWGRPLETTLSLFRGDRYSLSFFVRSQR